METIEEIQNLYTRLAIHRRSLAELMIQEAQYGSAFVPIHLINEIKQQRNSIQRLKYLLRSYGEPVSDHYDDEPPDFST